MFHSLKTFFSLGGGLDGSVKWSPDYFHLAYIHCPGLLLTELCAGSGKFIQVHQPTTSKYKSF